MAVTLSRIDRKSRTYQLSATVLAEAAAIPPDLTGVDVALLPPRSAPTAATVWVAADFDAVDGSFMVLLAGPDADSTGALVVPASADIWMRIADAPEVDAEKLERITVLGGGAIASLPALHVSSVAGLTGTVTAEGLADALVGETATHVSDGSALDTALRAALGRTKTSAVAVSAPEQLFKLGVILNERATTDFDASRIESPQFFRPLNGLRKYAALYVGYTAGVDAVVVGSIGIAYSDDMIHWDNRSQFFAASGIPGSPDEAGVTGPVYLRDNGVEYLFYIGCTAIGYEGGVKSLCLATRPIGGSTWTRHGTVLSAGGTGWRATHVWHPNFVKIGATWYCFINATGSDNLERTGVAQAPSLLGPWTWRDDISPVVPDPIPTTGLFVLSADPYVTEQPDGSFRMDFYRAPVSGAPYDVYATTTAEQFPAGWIERGVTLTATTQTYDQAAAHKPSIAKMEGGVTLHCYTAVNQDSRRRAALAATKGRRPILWQPNMTTAEKVTARALSNARAGVYVESPPMWDSFAGKADGALGTAGSGQAWVGATGWAVSSGAATFTGASDATVWIPTGLTGDIDVVIDITAIPAGNFPLGFSFGDPAGVYLKLYRNLKRWRMNRAPANTQIYEDLQNPDLTTGRYRLSYVNRQITLQHPDGYICRFGQVPLADDPSTRQIGLGGSGTNVGLKIVSVAAMPAQPYF